MDQRPNVGNVERHITNKNVWLRRLERLDQHDTLQLEILARPT
jgi:hypothetical protein